MAQGGIRKGFFFYFGLFVLLIIAIFLVILVILFFNPGKTIIGLQYFTGGETAQIMTTTDESKTPFDFTSGGNVKQIVVECNAYADVYVQISEDIHENCVVIENKASGFATSGQARPYEYSVTLESGVLTIKVQEPVGFLYFSDNISVTINIEAVYNYGNVGYAGQFDNIAFNVKTASGDIHFGTGKAKTYEIKPGNITAETTSGNIYLSKNLNLENVTELNLKTESGEITTDSYNVKINGSDNFNGQGIDMTKSSAKINLTTDTGLLDFDLIRTASGGSLYMTNENGNMTIGEIDVDVVEMNSLEGNYYFDTVTAERLTFTPSEDRIASPNIRIGTMNGDFLISSSQESSSPSPNVTIEELNGGLDITNINGTYNISKIAGQINVNSERATLNLSLKDSADKHEDLIETTSGNITLSFLGETARVMDIKTESGKVTINVVDATNFTSVAYNFDSAGTDDDKLSDDKITVNIGNVVEKNPIEIEPTATTRGEFTIFTNGNVEYVKK